jgi:raffinose synthase
MKTDWITAQGVGLMHPRAVYRFYDEQHAYLAAAGVDGVKVDEQCILETLGAGHGGRAQLTRQYHQALDASVAKNFPENGIIACMSHNTDALYWYAPTIVLTVKFIANLLTNLVRQLEADGGGESVR